jgi:hypothetical protein
MPSKVVRSAIRTTLGPRGKTGSMKSEADWAYYRARGANSGPYLREAQALSGSPAAQSSIDEACYTSYIPPG